MRTLTTPVALCAGLLATRIALVEAQAKPRFSIPDPTYSVRLEPSVMVPMRDGIKLSTDLYFPAGALGRLPAILVRTPYDKNPWRERRDVSTLLGIAYPSYVFASRGYVVAVQDTRGKFESEGEFIYAGGDSEDGYDATEWLARQPWSNGKIGTYGCSYLGETQYQQATQRHPNLTAMIPQAAGPMQYRGGGGINGGAIELASIVGWFRMRGSKLNGQPPSLPAIDYRTIWSSLPVIDMLKKAGAPPTDFEDYVSRDLTDPWWDKTAYIKPTDRFDVPALHINSWYDYGVGETLELFNQMRRNAETSKGRDHQFAIISPTTHCRSESTTEQTMVGRRDMGDARLDHVGIYYRWFEHWLKGVDNETTRLFRLQLYVMGRNQWRSETTWPLERTRFTKFYLRSDGRANSRFGSGALSEAPPAAEPPDSYLYDPENPVPTTGGALCTGCSNSAEIIDGALDQSEVEARQDVLVYTTPVLTSGVEVTGPLEAVLYVSSSATDTDFIVKLVDVYPDGVAYNLQEGILRARYREGFDRKVWMKPGEVYPIRINLHATSNYFPPGHRIRLEVTSSSFPRFDRNLNTGGNNYAETRWIVARNVIHHSAKYPSHLLLPVIPERTP
jgi:putative CocE/NonD family hydrolase